MEINNRIKRLRELMEEKGISAYIIPTTDPHSSEYVADYYKGRSFISGFTGSAGTALVTYDKALLWADGRYFVQAEEEIEGSEFELMKMGVEGVPNLKEWLENNLETGATLGFDGKLFPQKEVEDLEGKLKEKEIDFTGEYDLIGEIWKDRPDLPSGKAFILEEKYAGESVEEKLSRVREEMQEKDANILLLSSLDDIAWLFNIRGSDVSFNPVVISYACVTEEKAYLFVNKEKIDKDVEAFLNENNIEVKAYDQISKFVSEINKEKNVILDKKKFNSWLYKNLDRDVEVIDETNITTKLKAVKNETEIKNQKSTYIKDGVALVKFFHWIDKNIDKEEIDEISAAERLEDFRKEQDLYMEPSFGTISAYGPNAAMAHYSATEDSFSKLKPEGMYLVDSGGQYLDGTTDITRTVALGKLTEEEKKDYTLTLKGHINLINMKFLKGTTGYGLDIACRYPLWQEGLDFKHGTGHGVGFFLNVHEGPQRIANDPTNKVSLEPGMVVSIEPGMYRMGKHGIRIENIVVVEEDMETEFGKFLSFHTLSYVPIDSNCINKELLSQEEIQWLNNYHKEVYEKLSPSLDGEVLDWLKEKTKEI